MYVCDVRSAMHCGL